MILFVSNQGIESGVTNSVLLVKCGKHKKKQVTFMGFHTAKICLQFYSLHLLIMPGSPMFDALNR